MLTSKIAGVVGVIGVVVTALASTARADLGGKEFDLSIGYANLSLSGSSGPFDNRGGIYVEPRFSFGAGGDTSGMRFGIGVGISGFEKSHDEDFFVIDDDGDVFEIDGDSVESITLITPEIQLSWRQMLGPVEGESGQRRWFIEPGVGLGVVFGQYWVGDTFGFAIDTDISEWDTTLSARPFLRAGFSGDTWMFGLEGSYLFGGSLDFTEEVGGDLEEWYAGVFFGGRW